MQLPQTPDALVVVGTAAVVIGVLILLIHFLRRRMRRRHSRRATVDWTSGAATHGIGPWPFPADVTVPVDEARERVPPGPSGASESEGEEHGAVPPPPPTGAVDESPDASAAAGPDAAPSPELVVAAMSRVASGRQAPSPSDPAHLPLMRGARVPGEQ